MVLHMLPILIIGAGGYIGSRVLGHMRRLGLDVETLDLNTYGYNDDYQIKTGDAADLDLNSLRGKVVLYLPSFHQEPPDYDIADADAYFELMSRIPQALAQSAAHLVYVSSMRALTNAGSLYADTKLNTERLLLGERATIVRPGTAWGGLRKDLPNRCNTAINYALTRRAFSGDHWRGYTTNIFDLISLLCTCIQDVAAHPEFSLSQTINITDTPVPLVADDVRDLLEGMFYDGPTQRAFTSELNITEQVSLDFDEDVRAQQRLRTYYSLENE